MTTRKIVVGYDGSRQAHTALTWALDQAASTGTPVELVYASEWPVYIAAASMVPATSLWPDAETEHRITTMLTDAVTAAGASHPGVPVTTVIIHNTAALVLRDRSRQASLIVLGRQGHGKLADLLGSVSVGVTAHAHCPVVVVRGAAPGPKEPAGDVVVGFDGSPCSQLALGFAFDQAAIRRVPLRVIRAWTPPTPRWSSPTTDPEEIVTAERTALSEQLYGWQEKHPTVPVTATLVVDHPAAALIAASRTAQLAVVGSRGRGGFRGLLLGSVSQQLLHHGHCSIAVVRELAEHASAASVEG